MFFSQIAECTCVLYFDVSDDVMTSRLINRGKTSGRVDDNEETIKKRLQTFHNQTEPVVSHYGKLHKLVKVKCYLFRFDINTFINSLF